MQVVSVIAAKGGVGKTTVTANLCIALATGGRPVLAVDLDPQNALRFHLAADPGAGDTAGLVDAERGVCGWAQAMQRGHQGVVLLPFGEVDDEAQVALEGRLAAQPHWLADTLAAFRLPADAIVVLDTPPGPSVYLQQALRVSQLNVVTLLPDAGSFATLPIVERMVDKYCRPRADFIASTYVINQADASRRLSRDVLQTLRDELGPRLLGVVQQDQAVSEALASATTVRHYAPYSQAVDDFAHCTAQLLERFAPAAGAHLYR
ncbi:cellulose biosynthesis protein BcsQ [Variovorax sp. UMC13]|uniref:cellulose biosynthesis protein BcsQ n=1 Tax=Variovorax sp. UMC13 TaxID=1862326 RepID=UPI001603616D|nr:cellulose biosynthesis protein BcsQ [Variovorax sp. UMC13]MBB1600213.1 cellulose synthase operon protein YhjQ [Variovorax sp. UMC13]